MMHKLKLIALLALAALALAACGAGGTLTLSENDVEGLVVESLEGNDELAITNVAVDLRDSGDMVISGEIMRSGNPLPATITIVLAAQNGQIAATATEATVMGVALPQTAVSRFNNVFAQNLAARAKQDNDNGEITAVTITEDNMQVTLERTTTSRYQER